MRQDGVAHIMHQGRDPKHLGIVVVYDHLVIFGGAGPIDGRDQLLPLE
jgi:hypothetical protein